MKNRKITKIVKLGKYTIKSLKNYALIGDSKNLAKYVNYSECKKKSGYLNFIQNRPISPKNIIIVYPIFVTINKFTLSLFHSYRATSLFKIINLDSIQRVDLAYKNTFCFDVIINEILAKKLTSGPLTLCANSMSEMKDWIRSILIFKECKMKGSSGAKIVHQGRTLVDFNQINNLIKQKGVMSNVNQLFYDTKVKVYKDTHFKIDQREKIKKTVDDILESIKETKIAKNQMRTQFISQIKNPIGGGLNAISRSEDMLKTIAARKSYVENQKVAHLFKFEHKKRTSRLLKSVKSKILSLKVYFI